MRLAAVVALVGMVSVSLMAADVAGTWKGSMETQVGATEITITFQRGAGLAGKVKAGEYEGPIENGKLTGDRISFDAVLDPGKIGFEGTVSGDEMKLNVTGTQGSKYTLVCRRQKGRQDR